MVKVFESTHVYDQNELLEFLDDLRKDYSIILFSGQMGAGKTTIIKNFCNFIKVVDDIASPTYSLVNEYQSELGETIYHFDFYRIDEEYEALDIGVEEYFNSGNLCLIEWPEKIENLLPESYIKIEIEEENGKRKITLSTKH